MCASNCIQCVCIHCSQQKLNSLSLKTSWHPALSKEHEFSGNFECQNVSGKLIFILGQILDYIILSSMFTQSNWQVPLCYVAYSHILTGKTRLQKFTRPVKKSTRLLISLSYQHQIIELAFKHHTGESLKILLLQANWQQCSSMCCLPPWMSKFRLGTTPIVSNQY